MKKVLLTMKEACTALGCSRTTGYKLISDGKLDKVTVGSSPRITIASVEKLVKAAA